MFSICLVVYSKKRFQTYFVSCFILINLFNQILFGYRFFSPLINFILPFYDLLVLFFINLYSLIHEWHSYSVSFYFSPWDFTQWLYLSTDFHLLFWRGYKFKCLINFLINKFFPKPNKLRFWKLNVFFITKMFFISWIVEFTKKNNQSFLCAFKD